MSITAGRTAGEIRSFVEEYYAQPYGTRGRWLKGQGVGERVFRRWSLATYSGDLERGLVPRREDGMANSHRRRVQEQRAKDTAEAARQAELDRLHARIAELEGTNDALGKAIGLLHAMSEHEPDSTETTNDPSSS